MMSSQIVLLYEQDFDLSINIKWLEKAISRLSQREIEILRLRYGMGGNESMTLKAIGDQHNITAERVRQIEVTALKKLRESAGVDGGKNE